MSNKPANRPGHPRHGFNRRFPRSAKRRRQMEIQWNTLMNMARKQQNKIRWAEGARPTQEETEVA